MLSRFARLFLRRRPAGSALGPQHCARRPGSQVWVHPLDTPPRARCASCASTPASATLTPGQTAQLCYSRGERQNRSAFPPCRAPVRAGTAASTWCPSIPRTTPCWRKASMARSPLRSFTLSVQRLPAPRRPSGLQYAVSPQNHHPHPQPHQLVERRRQDCAAGKTAISRTAADSDALPFPPPRSRSFPACAPIPRRSCRWWTSDGFVPATRGGSGGNRNRYRGCGSRTAGARRNCRPCRSRCGAPGSCRSSL